MADKKQGSTRKLSRPTTLKSIKKKKKKRKVISMGVRG